MPHPLSPTHGTTRFILTRKELDFALGVGSAIIDVEISMQVCKEADMVHPLAKQNMELEDEENKPAGIVSTVIAAAAGGVEEAVEVKQAAED
jgi:phosphatidylinositol-3,4,5-trisphosphate 3-phosphatase and dual-specificity protein phosphatase PTEN